MAELRTLFSLCVLCGTAVDDQRIEPRMELGVCHRRSLYFLLGNLCRLLRERPRPQNRTYRRQSEEMLARIELINFSCAVRRFHGGRNAHHADLRHHRGRLAEQGNRAECRTKMADLRILRSGDTSAIFVSAVPLSPPRGGPDGLP